MFPGGTGIPDSDLHVFVTAMHTGSCAVTGSQVLAFASSCQVDQSDRPTFGIVNFCPYKVPTAQLSTYPSLVGTGIHEHMHVLGTTRALPVFTNTRSNTYAHAHTNSCTLTHWHVVMHAPARVHEPKHLRT